MVFFINIVLYSFNILQNQIARYRLAYCIQLVLQLYCFFQFFVVYLIFVIIIGYP